MSFPWERLKADLVPFTHQIASLLSIALALASAQYVFLIPAIYAFGALLFTALKARSTAQLRFGRQVPTRFALAALAIIVMLTRGGGSPTTALLAGAIFAFIPTFEVVLVRRLGGRRFRAANLPGVDQHNDPLISAKTFLTIDLMILGAAIVAGLLGITAALPAVLGLAALGMLAVVALDTLRRVRDSVAADNDLYERITAYAPKFILYYGVRAGTEYQVRMWIEYLERIGEPFIVVLRNVSTFETISAMTSAPTVVRASMRQLDDVVVPSVTTAFYVNNSALNTHLVRYPQICHIQLLHGDSDKATSFNPITAMFDKIFVAGQAGIDRYVDNAIDIPQHKFEIVGRPQVETIDVIDAPVRLGTVLYAPTWQGHYSDTNYSSLHMAEDALEELIRRGIRVIFRPHPYSYKHGPSRERIEAIQSLLRDSVEAGGPAHLWGAVAEQEMSIIDGFNECDALISDVSSVVPDFLYSRKPFALFSTIGSVEEFTAGFPLAKAAYLFDPDGENIGEVIDMLVHDPQADLRDAMRKHYLGPVDNEDYAEVFLQTCRSLVNREG